MYEFWYDCVKSKYGEKLKLCYMDTGRFIVYIKTGDIYKDIAEDVEIKLWIRQTIPKEKNKRVIGLVKDELNGKIITKFVGLRARTYSYLMDDVSEDKKVRDAKECVIKIKLKF